jgi:MoaA/NifB/PqqE/SkfB family radical SAM enzyme
MNPNLFQFCELLQKHGLKVSILSTGLLLKKYAKQVVQHTDEVIVSLDGSPAIHDAIRRVPKAFARLAEGVGAVKAIDPTFRITGRCVIQRMNFADWGNIVRSAQEIGLDEISFLPADVTSEAFNRPELWEEIRQEEIRLRPSELPQLQQVLTELVRDFAPEFESGYITESPEKLWRVYDYYGGFYGETAFPKVQCNAPWVSTVVEADGTVRPCYFHEPIGNVRDEELPAILNSPSAIKFRQNLDLDTNEICQKCVCTLNLRPTVAVA